MKETNYTKQTIWITTACVVFILLSGFYHHIDKYLTGVLFIILTLLIPITFIYIISNVVKGLVYIYKQRKSLTFNQCLPTIIGFTCMCYILFCPWQFNSEKLESDIEFRACYEGTQSHAYIKFRKDGSFELNSTGVFFSNKWFTGEWRKSTDTIFMKFDHKMPRQLSDTIIIKNEYLVPLTELNKDTSVNYDKYYYLGYCKGLN